MRTDWKARYLDGRTATRHAVVVRLTEGGLQIRFPEAPVGWWSYDEVRLKPSFQAGDPVVLERGGEFPENLQVSDPAFLAALRAFSPAHRSDFPRSPLRMEWRSATLILVAGILASALVLYVWLIPAMASLIAPHIPIRWERELGHAVLEELAPEGKRCAEEARTAPVEEIARRLAETIPGRERAFRVIVVNDEAMNAFALPGGTIVVFQGLLSRTRTPEELAGVVAHEIQHVTRRHIMKMLLEEASTRVILSAVIGDGGDALSFGVESARTLGTLRYSRGHEAEADAAGQRMLARAGIDPRGLIAFLETLREAG
ncbi:MAG: M48 family metallopeptidase, partial [Myxococcota bacterium]